MHIPFSAATRIPTPEGAIWDYVINKEVGVSYQELNMRGPTTGRYLNKVCLEIYFILEGSATFFVGDSEYKVKEKDVVVAQPGTAHHIETNGLKYITVTRPDWYQEQFEQVA